MGKNPAAVALGRRGGKKYAENTTAEARKKQAQKAAEARWAKTRALVDEITKGTKALEMKAAARARTAKARKSHG